MKKFLKYLSGFFLVIAVVVVGGSYAVKTFKTPKTVADWELGQERLAQIDVGSDGRVSVRNLRDFDWQVNEASTPVNYIDYDFALDDIVGVSVAVSHFSPLSDIAHMFIVFDLSDGRDIGISVESRREGGEGFSLLSGLMYDYELIYVVATADDLLNLRKVRDEKIYLYPIKTTTAKSRALFRQLATSINQAHATPQFYHLFARNCTNMITREVAKISDRRFPFLITTFLPGRSGQTLFDMGLIDTKAETFIEAQEEFLVRF